MKVFSEISQVRKYRWRDASLNWGLVPTMGLLHDGHLSLVRCACNENQKVGVSIFVNPIQFNNQQDLVSYPRDLERDLELLRKEGVDLVWTPTPDIVYTTEFQTFVEVERVTRLLEGEARPGHFRGVTTMVAKIFNVFQPHRAYFGQKDAQQAVVIRQMVRDLNFNLDLITCPTVREADGLAMSSRNARLSPAARRQAVCLFRALTAAEKAFHSGTRNAAKLKSVLEKTIESFDKTRTDYISVAHPETLEELSVIDEKALLSLAVCIDDVRLIDNLIIG